MCTLAVRATDKCEPSLHIDDFIRPDLTWTPVHKFSVDRSQHVDRMGRDDDHGRVVAISDRIGVEAASLPYSASGAGFKRHQFSKFANAEIRGRDRADLGQRAAEFVHIKRMGTGPG